MATILISGAAAVYARLAYLQGVPELDVDLAILMAEWIDDGSMLQAEIMVRIYPRNDIFPIDRIDLVVIGPEGNTERIAVGRSWPNFKTPRALGEGEAWGDHFRYKELKEGQSLRVEVVSEGEVHPSETLSVDEIEELGKSPVEPAEAP